MKEILSRRIKIIQAQRNLQAVNYIEEKYHLETNLEYMWETNKERKAISLLLSNYNLYNKGFINLYHTVNITMIGLI